MAGSDGDPVSDVLALVKAVVAVTGQLVAGGAWAVAFPAPERIKFAIVTRGACTVVIDGEAPRRANVGDVLLIVARHAFVMRSADHDDHTAAPASVLTLAQEAVARGSDELRIGVGDDFVQVGGHIELDAVGERVLTALLPPTLHLRADVPAAASLRWIVEQIAHERSAGGTGADAAATQLAQLMLVHLVRAHLDGAPMTTPGWPLLLRDARLAAALRAMHAAPATPWTLSSLAKVAGMSRTTFAVRFKDAAGVAPLAYLTTWRMLLAQRALRDDDAPVAAIARALGYASESAFSHAFKRETGTSPSMLRGR